MKDVSDVLNKWEYGSGSRGIMVYLLLKIEPDPFEKTGDQRSLLVPNLELEHIIHQTKTNAFITYNEEATAALVEKMWQEHDNHQRLLNCVGNLCLLPKTSNSSAGKKPLEEKVPTYYDRSAYTCTKLVPKDFSPQDCEERGQLLLSRMISELAELDRVLRLMTFDEVSNELVIFGVSGKNRYHKSVGTCKEIEKLKNGKVLLFVLFCCSQKLLWKQVSRDETRRDVRKISKDYALRDLLDKA